MSSRYRLEVEGMDLAPGESVRMGCPFCLGDGKTFSLTKTEDGALLYNCYRANCTAKGVLGHTTELMQVERRAPARPQYDFDAYRLELSPLPGRFGEFWHMSLDEWSRMGVLWHEKTGRLSFPMYTPNFGIRGYVQRLPPWNISAGVGTKSCYDQMIRTAQIQKGYKALTRLIDPRDPTLAWGPSLGRGGFVTVVEDVPSAFRLAAAGERAVALCGTHVSADAAIELAAHTNKVRWALDRDATRKAVEHCRAFRYMFSESRTALLDKDVKDMTEAEVDEWVSSLS